VDSPLIHQVFDGQVDGQKAARKLPVPTIPATAPASLAAALVVDGFG